jgi:hypothetical protein
MKISKNIIGLFLSATISFGALAAPTGSGVRGGGHTIDVDSTPYLMDLVSKAVCDWKKGDQILKELPELQATLKKLGAVDWYFSSDLKNEIANLNFCMTGPLYRVSPYDFYSVIQKNPNEKSQQAGYRLYDSAYINSDIYDRMNGANKAMLIIHETMHSYLSMNVLDRSLKLRSMVKVIDQVRSGTVVTRDKLHYAMAMNAIQFPLTVDRLDSAKAAVSFLKGSLDERKQAIMLATDVDNLATLNEREINALAPWDFANFSTEFSRQNLLREALLLTMKNLSAEKLNIFLNEKKSSKQNLAEIALNDFYLFSDEQKNVILSNSKFNDLIETGLNKLLNEKFSETQDLIVPSTEFQDLVTNTTSEALPLVRLSPSENFPTKLKWLVEAMITLQENNSLSAITANEKFYAALGLKNQKAQVATMGLNIERQRKVALETLQILSESLVQNLLTELENKVAPETYAQILKQINLNNF